MRREFPRVRVTEKGERSLRGGHPWVYAGEVTDSPVPPPNGELVDVLSPKGKYLGTGFYNERSQIRVRVVSRNTNDRFDDAFWERRLRYALDYRRTVMGEDFSCCRLLFGDADAFPGLTVDRFGSVLVAQVLCLGIDLIKERLFSLLLGILREQGVEITALYERNDASLRDREGLPRGQGFWYGGGDGRAPIVENGIHYDVDYIHGQKTGFFLDQKYNRAAVARLARDRRVLDCFTHTGAFALNAAAAGAAEVCAVDASADALEMAAANAARNGLTDRITFRRADVFDLLEELLRQGGHPYDLIILDPPAFTKSGATVKSAEGGYRRINGQAMRLLPRGGYLATCSCSHFMTDERFRRMLRDAAMDAAVELRQIEARQQAPDHPVLWNVPETDYLKFYIFQVV